jgi:hypothetical protein
MASFAVEEERLVPEEELELDWVQESASAAEARVGRA